MKRYLLAMLTASATMVIADDEQAPCTARDNGLNYDLSPLSASSDYVLTSYSGRNFSLNICAPVVGEPWNLPIEPKDIGGFTRLAHGDISIGKPSTSIVIRDGTPYLLLEEGSSCPQNDNMKASTAIRFVCDIPSEQGNPQLLAQFPSDDDNACSFFIEWKSKYACPVPDRYAYWKTVLMAIVILLVLVLTFLGLYSFHKMIKRRRDASSIPLDDHHQSWFAALGDQIRDLGRLLTGQDPWGHPNGSRASVTSGSRSRSWMPSFSWFRGRRSRRNFTRLPRSAEEEAMMGGSGGPFSVDDDDDDDVEHGTANGHGIQGDSGTFAEESAAWGSTRPHGMNSSGVIRL